MSGKLTSEIVKLFGLPKGQQRVGLVMRLETGGDLDSLLHTKANIAANNLALNHHLNLEFKLNLAKNIVNGLRQLHASSYVHGDMKPKNILLCDCKSSNVRLSDFGLTDFYAVQENSNNTTFRDTKTVKGTLSYCAPEMLPHKSNNFILTKPSRGTDMYAFAILVWEIMTGLYPFDKISIEALLIDNVHSNDPNINRPLLSQLPLDTPPAIRAMIASCWDKDRSKRMTATECYGTITHVLNVVSSKKYDIFFSHAWVDKCVLKNIMAWLTDLGYRVWYDEIDMGNNIPASMSEGIANSTVVLVCANSTYQGRPNCMFELRETARLYPDKILILLVEGLDYTKVRWSTSNKVISQEVKDILQFDTKMYCPINLVAQNPLWQTPDQVTPAMFEELRRAVQPLVTILSNAGCQPSMHSKI